MTRPAAALCRMVYAMQFVQTKFIQPRVASISCAPRSS